MRFNYIGSLLCYEIPIEVVLNRLAHLLFSNKWSSFTGRILADIRSSLWCMATFIFGTQDLNQ